MQSHFLHSRSREYNALFSWPDKEFSEGWGVGAARFELDGKWTLWLNEEPIMTDVVAAVIQRNGRVLIARRSEGKLSGKWEFPGGKVENGETPKAALKREIREEFGVSVSIKEFLDQCLFQIEENPFRLLAYFAEIQEDEIFPTEHDRIEWVLPGELLKYDLAGPDIPIARKLIRNS